MGAKYHHNLAFCDIYYFVKTGSVLLTQLQSNESGFQSNNDVVATLDNLEAQKQVKRTTQFLERKVEKIQEHLETRDRSLNHNLQYEELKQGMKIVSHGDGNRPSSVNVKY